jgi:hypothetical protein
MIPSLSGLLPPQVSDSDVQRRERVLMRVRTWRRTPTRSSSKRLGEMKKSRARPSRARMREKEGVAIVS